MGVEERQLNVSLETKPERQKAAFLHGLFQFLPSFHFRMSHELNVAIKPFLLEVAFGHGLYGSNEMQVGHQLISNYQPLSVLSPESRRKK